jgi:hypothetical protein
VHDRHNAPPKPAILRTGASEVDASEVARLRKMLEGDAVPLFLNEQRTTSQATLNARHPSVFNLCAHCGAKLSAPHPPCPPCFPWFKVLPYPLFAFNLCALRALRGSKVFPLPSSLLTFVLLVPSVVQSLSSPLRGPKPSRPPFVTLTPLRDSLCPSPCRKPVHGKLTTLFPFLSTT